METPVLPSRYEPVRQLGAGGGGEVWTVRDRIDGRQLALKALSHEVASRDPSDGSSASEVAALVREATILLDLSSSHGTSLPKVERFGRLADGRPYLVRELVEGVSLAGFIQKGGPVIGAARALLGAAGQLTQLHRAGMLHGDVKPANLIVRPDGTATLVDLGLATAWGPMGARPEGLTPRYAPPELFEGEPLTVRGEVYALGATLRDVLDGCVQAEATLEQLQALRAVERRATSRDPLSRHPSADELGAAIAAASGLAGEAAAPRGIWTIVASDVPLGELLTAVETLPAGGELSVVGPIGAGGRTLMAALAWRLALLGWPVAWLRGRDAHSLVPADEALGIELATALGGAEATAEAFGAATGVIVVEEPTEHDPRLARLRRAGARVVARRNARAVGVPYVVRPLDERAALDLVRRALPSLPEGVVARIVARGEGRPGKLRAIVDAVADRAIVRAESVDVIVAHLEASGVAESTGGEGDLLSRAQTLLEAGSLAEAEALLADEKGDPRVELLRAHIAFTRGEFELARAMVDALAVPLQAGPDVALRNEAGTLRAKIETRAGAYDRAIAAADEVLASPGLEAGAPAAFAEALQARGVAKIYLRDDAGAVVDLERAIALAENAGQRRIEALAASSLALAHQRAGRNDAARVAFKVAIAAAEAAGDASTLATTRLNYGVLAWGDGDLAEASAEFEAAADLARRVEKHATVERALINLAVVDLYLGRHARVTTTLRSLEAIEAHMTKVGRAQVLGVRADLAGRTGDLATARALYAQTIAAWHELGRPQDAAEAVIDDVLMRRYRGSKLGSVDDDLRVLDQAEKDLGPRAGELAAPLALARGLTLAAKGDETKALALLDEAVRAAGEQRQQEVRWQAHASRARLLSAHGSHARARRDADEAAAILEEIADKLPRDLREVYWDDARRRAVRQAHEATQTPSPSAAGSMLVSSGFPTLGPPISTVPTRSGGATVLARLAEDRLARILTINRDLACEPDLSRLLDRVTDQAIDLLGADRGFVLLADDAPHAHDGAASGQLLARAARDRGKDDPSVRFSRSICERVLQTGEPIVTNDARGDARLGEAASVHARSIASVACVPIPRVRGGDRAPIGVLYLESRASLPGLRRGPVAMEAELPTLLAFADQVGIAIANAKLVEENRRRADALEIANGELEQARAKLDDALARRTEQLEKTKADLGVARQALRGHAGYAGYKGLVGASGAMRRLYALVDRVRETDVPVLITGESGTGKEVVARAIHAGGARAKRPFLGVNCGAIPANLLESELFGHVRGAFTGAERDRKGLFREAEGGTILLDEIGEMPLKMQAGLLRVLQEKTVRPVGGNREETVDARVVCATNRDLEEMVARGTFREDLYYRINVVALHVPSLRDRADDVPLLVDHFLGVFAAHYRRERKTVSRDAIKRLQAHAWPGNVRQLEHVLLNAFVLVEGSQIEAADLALPEARTTTVAPSPPGARAPTGDSVPPPNFAAHKDSEKDRILAALEKASWNRLKAAQICGIPRRTFYRRLREYGIQG
jgi:transcriptional regulator with GAF, ATPase, and Fis domain/tetratricopeptide (TPR) repeat protein